MDFMFGLWCEDNLKVSALKTKHFKPTDKSIYRDYLVIYLLSTLEYNK